MSKVSMTSIDSEVQFHPNRDHIVRYADEQTALGHPTVKEKIQELKGKNRQLHEQIRAEKDKFQNLVEAFGTLSMWEFIHYKQGAVNKKLAAKLGLL